MNGETLVPVVAALLCVLAVSGAAASLESSIAAAPGDGITLDYDGLPVSQEHADAVVERVTTVADEAGVVVERITVTTDARAVVDELDAVAEEIALDDDARPAVDRPPSAADWDRDAEFSSASSASRNDADDSNSQSEDWRDRLAGLLRGLRSLLLAFGLFAVALAYRRADALSGLVPDVRSADPRENDSDAAEDEWPTAEPSDEVSRAWAEMIRRLDVEEPRSKTTAECAAVAVASGMDPEAVRTVTRTFEEVRYGDGRVTDERVRRVRRALRELERGGESP